MAAAAGAVRRRLPPARAQDRGTPSATIMAPTEPSSSHIGDADGQIELAERAQFREQPHPGDRSDNAAGQQHQRRARDRARGGANT